MNYSRVLVIAAALAAPWPPASPRAPPPGGYRGHLSLARHRQRHADHPELLRLLHQGRCGQEPAALTADQQQQALDNLIRAQLVAQQAQKEGVDKTADTQICSS